MEELSQVTENLSQAAEKLSQAKENRNQMTEALSEVIWDLYEMIQLKKPLVHCITNMVTVNDCANILLAAGASPTMACHPQEAAEVTAGCNSLVLNFGAIKEYEAMLLAGKNAHQIGHPIIIDPVGVGGSTYRRNMLTDYLQQIPVSCIRGNASEILALLTNHATVTGVDASSDAIKEDRDTFVSEIVKYSRKTKSIIVVSGEKDLITDGFDCYEISNGHPLMARITGAGCMSSAILGAFFGVQIRAGEPLHGKGQKSFEKSSVPDGISYPVVKPMFHAVAACVVMGVCGELAAVKTQESHGGTMTFHMHLIDAMSMLTKEVIEERIQIKKLNVT